MLRLVLILLLALVVPATAEDIITLNYAYNGAICSTGSSGADNSIDGSKVLLPVSPYVEQ